MGSSGTLDLQAALTAATLDLDGTISNTAGTSSLVISGASSLGGSVTTTSTQTYTGATTLTGNTTLATTSAKVTFSNTINSEGSETNNLTITASETEFNGIIGGTRTLGVMDINGTLDLNAAITNATSIDVSGTSNLGANVTTTGTQTYTGAVTLSTDVTLTTTNSDVVFGSTVTSTGGSSTNLLYYTTNPTRNGNGEIVYESGYGLGGTDAAANYSSDIDTVTYRMEYDQGGTTYYTEVTFDAWDGISASALKVPDNNSNKFALEKLVSNMTITSNVTNSYSGSDGVTTGTNKDGYLEIWTYNYGRDVSGNVSPAGSNTTYDFDDTHSGTNGYGSFQVHNLTDRETVFAWNNHSQATADIGFGDQSSENPDWTFARNYDNSDWALKISVNASTTPSQLTINNGTGETQFSGTVSNMGVIDINGDLNLDANITSATSIDISSASDLAGSITTTSTQTYTGAVTLRTDVTLTTTDSNVTFSSTVDGDGTARDLTIDTNGNTGTILFDGLVGNSNDLDAITITGNLDLDAAISNTTSISVSGTSNLAANVTTTSTQTYTGNVTINGNRTLTTTNSNVTFSGTTNAASAGDTLTIAAGSGDVTFTGAVGGSTALGNTTITTGALSAANMTVQGTIDVTNTSASSITGVIADGASAAILTKAGSGTLTLSGTNTFTGDLTISAGTVTMTGTLADTVDVVNSGTYDVDASDTIQSLSGSGAVQIASGQTLTFGDGNDKTISGVISGAGNLTKTGAGTLTLSADNTFSGDLTISAGTVTMEGTLADTVDVINSGTYDVDATDTIQSLSGSGAVQIDTGVTLTTGNAGDDTISGVISGAGNLTKTGAGTLTLSGNNTYTGDTTINAGILEVSGSLADTTDVILSANGIYDVDLSDTIQSLSGSGIVGIDNGQTLTFGDGNDQIMSGQITGEGSIIKHGSGTFTLSGVNNTYTGDTSINAGIFELTGSLSNLTDLSIASGATLDLQVAQTFASLDLDGTISNTAGTSSIIISGNTYLEGNVITSGFQDYGTAILTGATELTTSNAQVTFDSTINSEGSETNNLTVTASETEFNGIIGGTRTLGVMDINGTLDLNAAITAATSIDVSGTSNLGANITTTGTQTYTGAVTLSANTTLTSTTGSISANTIDGGYALNMVTGSALTISNAIGANSALTKVNLSTTTGNLTLGSNITVSGTGTDAMIFNAGSDTAAGTTTGGNIIISDSPTLTTGAGARTTFYTGSISGSTGLTSLIGSGTHRFRYNSDETNTNYSAALTSGQYAIYREQPTLTITADDETLTYGTAPAESVTTTGMQNGDTSATVVTTDASISIAGDTSTSGNYTVGDHADLTGADAGNYTLTATTSADSLTVNPYDLTVTIADVTATYGDENITAGTVTITDAMSTEAGDDVVAVTASIVAPSYSTSGNLKANTYSQITGATADLTGADAGNYTLTATTSADSLTVNPYDLTVTIADVTATYGDENITAVDVSAATFTGLVEGDDVTVSATGVFSDMNVGVGKTVTLTETYSGDDVGNYTISAQGTTNANITAKALAINTDISSTTKVYDGTTNVVITSANLTGVVDGDDVTASGSGNFDNKNVGTNKTITVAYELSGDDSTNYSLDGTTATGDITAKVLTYSVSAADKSYDGDTSANATISLTNLVGNETLTVSNTSTFTDKNVGLNKTVTVDSINLANGANGGLSTNYSIVSGETTTADITAKVLTYSVSAADKSYDGDTSANATISLTNLVGNETLTVSNTSTFTDKNVGLNKTVTVDSINLANGANGGLSTNYSIVSGETTTADITAKALAINTDISSTTKVYDGTTNVVITSANLTGVVDGDDVTASGSGNFDNKNVGTNKTITVAYELSGDDSTNYSLEGTTATGDITAKPITVSGITAANKTYDGDTSATIDVSTASFTGLVEGDDVTVSATGVFSNKNVDTNKTVTLTETNGGDDVGNYNITAQGTTTANITAKALSIGGITASNKVYDGDTSATIDVSAASFTGLVEGDDVTVSATGVFSNKNVDTNKTVTLTETNGGDDVGNYNITAQGTTTANITAKALTATITAQDKVYDASNQAIVSLALSGYVGDETLVTTETTARFNNINVGERTATVTAITLSDGTNGGLASNYSIATGQTDTANITPALLTITAANAAKFVRDNDPEFTVIYNGFVGSEDSSDLTTIGTVARTDANSAAGTYEGVIAPSGYAADNYTFNYVNGDLTIVPSDGLIIDINLAENNISYGSAISYDSVQATYWDENTNQSRNVDDTNVDGSSVVVNHDGTQVSFVIAPVSSETDCSLGGCYSSSNRLNTGGYNLGAENNEVTVNDDSTIAIIGSLNVLRKVIDPDDLSISEVSKVYDGSTEISSVTASYIQDNTVVYEGDDLQITASGSYSSRHVGINKPINIDLSLSGDDSNNYAFEVDNVNGTNLSLNSGTITQLDSVTWAGDAEGGLWSAADSWVNGAIPDNDNVALVTIPENISTTLDADSFGTFSSAIVNSGTIILNNANEYELGNTLSGAGTIRFSGDGTITLSGNNSHTGITDITDSSLTIDHANALGSSILNSSDGSLSISSGLTLDSLTTTGTLKLLTDVNTTNDQTYGGNIEVLAGSAADPLEINSISGDITFNGTLTAGAGSKDATRSLSINSNYKENDQYVNAGEVTFNDSVGYAFNGQIFTSLTGTNFYNFDITGNSINLNADIMTFNAQEYSGPVLIGDNGENGKTRRLMSIDPSVTFNHSINDSDGTHTLIVEAYALSANGPAPTITANGEIGNEIAFATPVQFITGIQDTSDNNNNVWGTLDSSTPNHVGQSINIQGNTTTTGSTTFSNFTGKDNPTPVATTTNNYVGGNQMSFIQRLLQQIKQNSNSLSESSGGGTPVVEVGAVLEECEGLSDESECLTE